MQEGQAYAMASEDVAFSPGTETATVQGKIMKVIN